MMPLLGSDPEIVAKLQTVQECSMKIVSWRSPEMLGEDETQPVLLEITLPQHPVNSVPQLWLVFSP